MPTVIDFVDVLPLGEIFRLPQTDSKYAQARELLDRPGAYVSGFVFPERSYLFMPYYVGKHEISVWNRLEHHYGRGLLTEPYVILKEDYLRHGDRLRYGYRDPKKWGSDDPPISEAVVYPRSIIRQGRKTIVDRTCDECGGECRRTCKRLEPHLRAYRAHFQACAYLLPRGFAETYEPSLEELTQSTKKPAWKRVVASLERVVKDQFVHSATFGEVGYARDTDYERFAFSSTEFPYPLAACRYEPRPRTRTPRSGPFYVAPSPTAQ